MSDTVGVDAVRVGRGGLTLGWRSAAAIITFIVGTAGGSVAYIDSRFDELERGTYLCAGLAGDFAELRDDVDGMRIKVAELAVLYDAGIPAGR